MAQQLVIFLSQFSMAPRKQQPELAVDLVPLCVFSVCTCLLGRNQKHSIKACSFKIRQKLVMYVSRMLGRTKCNSEEECNSMRTLHRAGHGASWKGLCTMSAFQPLPWHIQGSSTKDSKISKYSPFYRLPPPAVTLQVN